MGVIHGLRVRVNGVHINDTIRCKLKMKEAMTYFSRLFNYKNYLI